MKNKNLYLISTVAALAGLLFGYDTGVISGAILFINRDFQLSPQQTELIVSAVLLGAFVSAMLSGKLCDLIGRKKILLLTAMCFILGSLISAAAGNANTLIVGRLILGVAIGIASYTAPLYLAEIAPPERRGFIVTLNQLFITLGILFSYIVDYHFAESRLWQMMLLVGVIPALLLFFGMLALPESPRFLVITGRLSKARTILRMLREDAKVSVEIDAIIESQKQKKLTSRDLLEDPRLRTVLLIGVTLAIAQQITGINTIIYYAPTVFEMAGFHSNHAILVTALLGIVNVAFTLIALPLIDKLGRKKLLLWGLSGMCLSLLCLSFAFAQQQLNQAERMMAVISMMVYIASFAISLGPMVFVILSEIFPLSIRGQAMSLAMCANWGSNLLVAISFLSLTHGLGTANTFTLFATLCVASLIFVHHFIPETKGISLEQIEKNIWMGLKSRNLGRNHHGDSHAIGK